MGTAAPGCCCCCLALKNHAVFVFKQCFLATTVVTLEHQQDDGNLGEETKHTTTLAANTEMNAEKRSRGGEGEGEDERGGGVFEDEEPSILERIMPPLPASRREVFLSVEAFSGLEQPFTAKGDQVSGRVFWNGEEVC